MQLTRKETAESIFFSDPTFTLRGETTSHRYSKVRPYHFNTVGSVCLVMLAGRGEGKGDAQDKWHLWSNTSSLPSAWRCKSTTTSIFSLLFVSPLFICSFLFVWCCYFQSLCIALLAIKCFLLRQRTSEGILLDSQGFAKEIFGTARGRGCWQSILVTVAIKIATTFGTKCLKEKTFLSRCLFKTSSCFQCCR